MIDNISWQSYWFTISLILAGYYLIIYLVYFRSDFSIKFHRSHQRDGRESIPNSPIPEEHLFNTCLGELTAFFEEAKYKKWDKNELLNSLRRLFGKYSSLNTTEFYGLLTHIVVSQCESNCSIHLNAEEVQGVVGKVNE